MAVFGVLLDKIFGGANREPGRIMPFDLGFFSIRLIIRMAKK